MESDACAAGAAADLVTEHSLRAGLVDAVERLRSAMGQAAQADRFSNWDAVLVESRLDAATESAAALAAPKQLRGLDAESVDAYVRMRVDACVGVAQSTIRILGLAREFVDRVTPPGALRRRVRAARGHKCSELSRATLQTAPRRHCSRQRARRAHGGRRAARSARSSDDAGPGGEPPGPTRARGAYHAVGSRRRSNGRRRP